VNVRNITVSVTITSQLTMGQAVQTIFMQYGLKGRGFMQGRAFLQ